MKTNICSTDHLDLPLEPGVSHHVRLRGAVDEFASDLREQTELGSWAYRELLVAALRHIAEYCLGPADLPYDYSGPDPWRRRISDWEPPPPPTPREVLVSEVGNEEDLASLTAEALPDEEPDFSAVDDAVRERLRASIEFADPVVLRVFGIEFRTAVRRLLVDAALANPDIFLRKGRTDTLGAGACLAVAEAHQLVGHNHPMRVSGLMAHFGLTSSPESRCHTLRSAVSRSAHWRDTALPPRYLTGARRAELIERRDALDDDRS